MNRYSCSAVTVSDAVPRTRGDEPVYAGAIVVIQHRSPHARG